MDIKRIFFKTIYYRKIVSNVFITGTNRGIGLELVKQYHQDGQQIFATYHPSTSFDELKEFARGKSSIELLALDVTDEAQIKKVVTQLKNTPIDILINNAGIYGSDDQDHLSSLTVKTLIDVFTTNTIGSFLITKYLMPNVIKSDLKIIATISSKMGSINNDTEGEAYAYRTSKAAVNMIMKNAALEFQDAGIKILLLHPGSVKTNMNPTGDIDVVTSVRGLKKAIQEKPRSDKNIFYDYQGNLIAW